MSLVCRLNDLCVLGVMWNWSSVTTIASSIVWGMSVRMS